MDLACVTDAYQLIVLPVFLELIGRRELAAGDLQRDLHAAIPHIVKVLHAAGQRIPGGTVCDAILEGRRGRLACHAPGHLGMVAGIDQGQVLEDIVVGRQRRRCRIGLEHCAQGTCSATRNKLK